MRPFYQLMGVDAPVFDPEHTFTTSWLLSPTLFACLRGLIALYCTTVTITYYSYNASIGQNATNRHSFSYFTILTYWGLMFYFIFATLHTVVYARKGYSLLQRWPRPLQALHTLLYTTIITLPFLVTLIFWIVLYKAPWFPLTFTAWSNVSQHGLNSLFALVELFLPATNPPPWLHTAFLILLLLLYLGVAYITYATEGFYVYSFLDPGQHGRGVVAGYILGIAAGTIIIFTTVWGIIKLRKKFTRTGRRSSHDLDGRPILYSDTEMSAARMK